MRPGCLLIIFNILSYAFADDHLDGELLQPPEHKNQVDKMITSEDIMETLGKRASNYDDCACLSDTTIPYMLALISQQNQKIARLESMMSSWNSGSWNDGSSSWNGGYSNDCNSGASYVQYGMLHAMCDQQSMDGRWTVVQRRYDGSVNFYRTYREYVRGFGNKQEYWLGLERMHELTKNGQYELLIHMTDRMGRKVYAYYNYFMVDSASRGYRMQLGDYQGNAGDSLSPHANQPFSARDMDRDKWMYNCAQSYMGGWWYVNCHSSNLNGKYYRNGMSDYGKGINWKSYFNDYYGSFMKVEMKVRRRR